MERTRGIGMPLYWRHSRSTELRPAIQRYLRGQRLGIHDLELMQAYLRQWIMSAVWDQMTSPGTDATLLNLRARIGRLWTEEAVRHWIETATAWGLDPL
jgi:hypothetical protein